MDFFRWTYIGLAGMAATFLVQSRHQFFWLGLALFCLCAIALSLSSASYNALLAQVAPPQDRGKVSGLGFSIGYFCGIVTLLVAYHGFIAGDDSERGFLKIQATEGLNVRTVLLAGAIWALLWSLPILLYVPSTNVNPPPRTPPPGLIAAYRQTVREFRSLHKSSRQTVYFIVVQAIYGDALSAVFSFSALFATTVYGLTRNEVLLFGVAANMAAALGALAGGWLDDLIGSRVVILGSLLGVFGPLLLLIFLEGPRAFWVLGLSVSLFVGPVQSSTRAYVSRLSPPDREGQLFGLSATAGRALSFLTPSLIGLLTHAAGTPRAGIAGILVVLLAGLVGLLILRPRL